MISLITVSLERLKPFLDIFFRSIVEKTKIIDEVILPCADQEEGYLEEWEERGIKFVKFGAKQHLFIAKCPATFCVDHACNLHAGINRAKNDFVLLSDPDVFFYSAVDEFYMEIIEKYKLNYIGVSHPAAITQAFTYFPNVLNCMGKKSEFPDDNFLKGKLCLDNCIPDTNISLAGKFLAAGSIPDVKQDFPNPNGHFETGCNMVLWAKEKNWRWLSFQTADCFSYTSQYYRGTVKVDRLPKKKLIYHATNGSVRPENLVRFKESYEASREISND